MSIIYNRREEIIRDNNTAQDELEGMLSRLDPNTKQLIISTPLHGDIDFATLTRSGFRNIETIRFEEPGEITTIKNLPDSLHVLKCNNQLLIGLFELPPFLEELDCDYNYITEFSGDKLKNLAKLHISHNRLEKLDGLLDNLEELYCTNNKLQLLNLDGLDKLKVLHVSENPTLVIEHVPEGLVDFKSDNSPFAVVRYDGVQEPGGDTTIGKMNEVHYENKIDYLEALNVYFKLKKNYEESFFSAKQHAFRSAKSKTAAKRLAALVKPKCINCRLPGGTIFEHKDDKYTAVCGVPEVQNKCNLNIQLYRGHFSDEENILYIFKKGVDEVKEKIVRQKLDTLFDYVSDKVAAQRFKKEVENYNFESSIYNEILQSYNEKYYSKTKQDAINEKTEAINQLIDQYNSIIDDYKNNPENNELLRDAIRLQTRSITPEMENLRRLKNELNEVIIDIDTVGNTYTIKSSLVQRKITLANMDITLEEPPRVVKFSKKA
uniref:Uncharacterized protein n=1 Tax=viral metagenome TaxID=1070528 RepID=A0A6C0K0V2_9ZZZZ